MRKLNCLSRVLILVLIVAFALSMTVLTPEVEAASESPITETKTETSTYNNEEDDSKALARAIAMDEAKLEAESIIEELLVETEKETQGASSTSSAGESDQQAQSSSSGSSTSSSNSGVGTYVDSTPSTNGSYLMDIANPDPNYAPYAIHLSAADREAAERIVMGEAGHTGYTGMALVAQSLRDNFVRGGYPDIATTIDKHGYSGTQSLTPSQQCKEVVNFIFDQGGSAVQHRVLAFYASDCCSSPWHESQNFVCQYGYVRFFDFW